MTSNGLQSRTFRTACRWSQFVTMAIGQLSGRRSSRDLIDNVSAEQQRLYHPGSTKLSRSNLSRINEDKPHELYESLFAALLKRCHCATFVIETLLRESATNFSPKKFSLAATTIAAIYKSRWQIELFLKWIKQNLKIKSFMGTSKNAVMTQFWIALCVCIC